MRLLSHLATVPLAKIFVRSLPQEAVLVNLLIGGVHGFAQLLEIGAAVRIDFPLPVRQHFALVLGVDDLQMMYKRAIVEIIAH